MVYIVIYFQCYGIPQHFGLFYAMGGSLIMEGFLSACYHICPNNSNYQFGEYFFFETNGGIDVEIISRMTEVEKIWGGLSKMFQFRSLRINTKGGLYEGVAVLTVLHGAETCNIGVAKRKKLNVMEMRSNV